VTKTALVTGSARGIGRTLALGLARRGFDVAVHYHRSRREAEQVAAAIRRSGRRAVTVAADLTDPEQAALAVERAASFLGGLSVLINNVGDYLYKPIEVLSADEWRYVIDSNLNSAFYTTQAALPYLQRAGWGRIVFIGYAGAGQMVAKPHITPYFIAKTGLILYARALAKRLAGRGVTVNVVSPGIAKNSMTQPLEEVPMGRAAELEEVEGAVAYFLSPEADYVTGQVLEVAGGWNL